MRQTRSLFLKEFVARILLRCISEFSHLSLNVLSVVHIPGFYLPRIVRMNICDKLAIVAE